MHPTCSGATSSRSNRSCWAPAIRRWRRDGRSTTTSITTGSRTCSVFYTTNGYAKKGDDLGGYNRDVRGWVQVSRTIFPGTAIQPNSVSGGTQFALFIKYQRWAGNWWLKVGNEWVGYYPARLFTNLGLRNSADSIQFYGEVADARLPAGKTRTDMGSGRWADTRWPNAAYAHNLRYREVEKQRHGGFQFSGRLRECVRPRVLQHRDPHEERRHLGQLLLVRRTRRGAERQLPEADARDRRRPGADQGSCRTTSRRRDRRRRAASGHRSSNGVAF